ncbi:MAG: hypothetical protein EU536_01420 [Promethearchaeota archaeon]|nr:MAG: hypothetical protein EU536_01420 [Candidatus Lokiarchaeota archaeon]
MKPIILDVGSYSLRVGYGGEYAPRFDIPLITGSIRQEIDFITKKRIFDRLGVKKFKEEYFFGHEALYLQNYLDIQWVYDGKMIQEEFFFDKIVEYAADLLKKSLTNQVILFSMPFYSQLGTQLGAKLFSTHGAYEIIPSFQPLLNAIASGVATGLIIDVGHSLTQITPIVNGIIAVDGVQVMQMGGRDITEVLVELLRECNAFASLNESAVLSPIAIAENVKRLFCYVSRNPENELDDPRKRGTEAKFPLLGNEVLQIGVERFLAPEVLFAPQKPGVVALDKALSDVINLYDSAIQGALLGNIVLTGGTSLLPGLAERLYEDLTRTYNYKVNVIPFAQFGTPRYSTFFGAAKLATIEISAAMKVMKTDYEYAGTLNLPVAMLEEFPTLFAQMKGVELKPTIISVKNLHNQRMYQELYHIINGRHITAVREIGAHLERPPLEIYHMIETLLSYEIIQGEFDGFNFVNTQYRDESGTHPAPREVIPQESEVTARPTARAEPPVDEGDYIPTFQRLDDRMPDQMRAPSRRPLTPGETYVPSFEQLDTQMPNQMGKQARRMPVAEGESDYVPSFQQLDEQMPDQMEIKPIKYSGLQEELAQEDEGFEYTFEKIDHVMKEKWEKDDTITTGKSQTQRKTELLEESGPSFMRVDQARMKEWEQEGIVSTPTPVKPRGFFDELALPAEPSVDEGTFGKVEQEKTTEWAADDKVITEKPKSARDKLKALLEEGPSYARAEVEKAKEWDESGLILMPHKPTPKGFFAQPQALEEQDLPTFLRIKPEATPQPKKVLIGDLLKPKEEISAGIITADAKVPTFLRGQELTAEQLRQIQEFEEEERKKKEKEEKLL